MRTEQSPYTAVVIQLAGLATAMVCASLAACGLRMSSAGGAAGTLQSPPLRSAPIRAPHKLDDETTLVVGLSLNSIGHLVLALLLYLLAVADVLVFAGLLPAADDGISALVTSAGYVLLALAMEVDTCPARLANGARGWWRARACLLYTSPSPRDMRRSRMPSSA